MQHIGRNIRTENIVMLVCGEFASYCSMIYTVTYSGMLGWVGEGIANVYR